MSEPAPAFSRLIAPVDVQDFFGTYWEKQTLFVRRDAGRYYDDVLRVADLDRYFQSQHLSPHFVAVVKDGDSCAPERWTRAAQQDDETFRVVDLNKLLTLFSQGATILIKNGEMAMPSLTAFARALEYELKCPVQANLYVTPRNAQGFAPHFDAHSVFIMQIHGCKRWRLYDAPMPMPARTRSVESYHYEDREPSQTIDLRPGDLLFIPRGTVHVARADDTASIHITLSPMVRRWSYLLHQLARQANERPAFRRLLPHGLSSEQELKEFAAEFVRELQALLTTVDLPALHHSGFIDEAPSDGRGRFADLLTAEQLNLDSVVRTRPSLNSVVDRNEEWITVRFDGEEVVVPVFLAPAIDALLHKESFAIREVAGIANDAGKLALVKRFVKAGLLTVVSA